METRDYFTAEQLERQVAGAKAEIRYIQRKILIEQVGTTLLLLYFLTEVRISWIWLPLLMPNLIGWLLWMYLATLHVRGALSFEYSSTDFAEDYRRLSYYLIRLNYREALFDLLTGLQFFCLVSGVIIRLYIIRW